MSKEKAPRKYEYKTEFQIVKPSGKVSFSCKRVDTACKWLVASSALEKATMLYKVTSFDSGAKEFEQITLQQAKQILKGGE